MDADNKAFAFSDDIDVDLLEIASDTLDDRDLPVLFELRPAISPITETITTNPEGA
jgi:hypothetical protein